MVFEFHLRDLRVLRGVSLYFGKILHREGKDRVMKRTEDRVFALLMRKCF